MAEDPEGVGGDRSTDPGSDVGQRSQSYRAWSVPREVKLDGDRLHFTATEGGAVTGQASMLESFAGIADQPDEMILTFASEWGILNICEHELPASHLPARYLQWMEGDPWPCHAPGARWRSEPLAAWRNYAKKAQTILNLGARLTSTDAEQPAAHMWQPLFDFGIPGLVAGIIGGDSIPDLPRMLASAEDQKRLLGAVIQSWLDLGDVQAFFSWNEVPQFDLGDGNLFGAIGVQLALAVAKRDGLALCDECGMFFLPQRQNRPTIPKRCPRPACRQRAAKRESARRRRARERGETG